MRKTLQQFKDFVKNQGWAAEIQYDFLTHFKYRPNHQQLMRRMIHSGLSINEALLDDALNAYQQQWNWIMQSTWAGMKHRLLTDHADTVIYDYTGGYTADDFHTQAQHPQISVKNLLADLETVFTEYLESTDAQDRQSVMDELDHVKQQYGEPETNYWNQPLIFYIEYINYRYERQYQLTICKD